MSRPEAFVTLDKYKADLANLDYQRKYALERVQGLLQHAVEPFEFREVLEHLEWALSVPADQLLFAPFPDEVQTKKEAR